MGLAGRKTKQRIGADPRNLTWSGDSAKFGTKYLQSLGWTSGTGLGVSGEGRTSNLKIHQKLDLMGIGANRRGHDGDDAGWSGGREFEGLLARLNQAQNVDTQEIPVDEERGPDDGSTDDDSTRGAESTARKEMLRENDHPSEPTTNGKAYQYKARTKGNTEHKKKRKRYTAPEDEVDEKEAKRRREEEKREKKVQKKAKKAAKKLQNGKGGHGNQTQVVGADDFREKDAEAMKATPRYRAHRARNIASKRLAAASATGMNEILGISSSTSRPKTDISSIPFPTLPQRHPVKDQASALGFGLLPPTDHSEQVAGADGTGISTLGLGSHSAFGKGLGCRSEIEKGPTPKNDGNDLLRKSGKSVAEYFAEKMRMKGMAKNAPTTQ